MLASGRGIDLGAISIARDQSKSQQGFNESDEEFERSRKISRSIVELLEEFIKNPNELRTKLKFQLGFAGMIFYFLFIY